ncbi:MAG: hypothetical protein ACK41W_03635 [Cyanobacteriota bacterium]
MRSTDFTAASETGDIGQLRPDSRNARRRTDRSASLIAKSLERFGAARSIVIDEDGRILAGNGTVEGAKAAGISKLRIIETDGDELVAVRRTGLTEEQKIGLALADNRTSDLSEWDGLMLQQLSETHDVSPWFESEDLEAIIGGDSKVVEQLPPEDFPEAGDDLETDYRCPSCGYEWSGKTK